MVGLVFVLSPIPGNVCGAWYVQRKLGGYRNYAKVRDAMKVAVVVGTFFHMELFCAANQSLHTSKKGLPDLCGCLYGLLFGDL